MPIICKSRNYILIWIFYKLISFELTLTFKTINSHSTASASRNHLLIGTGAQGGPSQSSNSTSTNEHIPHRELRQIQVQVMEGIPNGTKNIKKFWWYIMLFPLSDQDRGLEELSKIIGRQRQMAQAIGDEVESQNSILNVINHQFKCNSCNIIFFY